MTFILGDILLSAPHLSEIFLPAFDGKNCLSLTLAETYFESTLCLKKNISAGVFILSHKCFRPRDIPPPPLNKTKTITGHSLSSTDTL